MIALSKLDFFTGRPIPGLYGDVDESIYHAWDLASSHRLGLLRRSPAHLRSEVDNPGDPSDEMILGSAIHALVLEPDKFSRRFVVSEKCGVMVKSTGRPCDKAGKFHVGGIWYCGTHVKDDRHAAALQETVRRFVADGYQIKGVSEFRSHYLEHPLTHKRVRIADHAPTARTLNWMLRDQVEGIRIDLPPHGQDDGRRVLTQAEFDTARRSADAVLGHPQARVILAAADAMELSAVCDHRAGARCKMRADLVSETLAAVFDLKTTQDASANEFEWQANKLNYFGQGALYVDILQTLGVEVDRFGIIAVEVEPFAVAVHELDQDDLGESLGDLTALIERYAECERSGIWPGYSAEINTIRLRRRRARQPEATTF